MKTIIEVDVYRKGQEASKELARLSRDMSAEVSTFYRRLRNLAPNISDEQFREACGCILFHLSSCQDHHVDLCIDLEDCYNSLFGEYTEKDFRALARVILDTLFSIKSITNSSVSLVALSQSNETRTLTI